MSAPADDEKLNQVVTYIKDLESRISRIEVRLNLDAPAGTEEKLPPLIPDNMADRADSLENQIGQFWFAKIGITILSIGIVFLLTFPYKNLPAAAPCLAGYALVGILIWLSNYWKESLQYLSHYIFGGALLLFYFTTMRLHFFGAAPMVENRSLEVILLAVVSSIHLYISYKKKSAYLSSIGITLGALTALIGDNLYPLFIISALLALFVLYMKINSQWKGLFIYGINLIYLTNLLWFINNPVMGNPFQIREIPYLAVFPLLVYAVIFSIGNLTKMEKDSPDSGVIAGNIINCIWSYAIFFLITIVRFKNAVPVSHLIASIIFLSLSILFWTRIRSKYPAFFYSILGYTALSVAIIAQFPKPDFFVWLCWQSLIVMSTALWFRSKIIITANFVMYLLIFISYLMLAGTLGTVSLSFGIVAVISARILNWKKDRLDLKTEAMRNAYLAAAFFIFPYALYNIVPKDYVAIAWTAAAIAYYIISIILNNKKYRWMALLTFFITVIYALFVGTVNLEPIYRIISFILLGVALLVISIYYGRPKSKSVSNSQSHGNGN
jgi:Predicted membrane protein (DUF2339)